LDVDDSAAALPDITAAFHLLGLRLFTVSTYPAEQGRLRVVARVERAVPLTSLVDSLRDRGLETVHAADGGNVIIELARAQEGPASHPVANAQSGPEDAPHGEPVRSRFQE